MEFETQTKVYDPKRGRASFRKRLKNLVWRTINLTLYRWSPFICRGWRRFLVRCFGGKIASTASLERLAIIDFPWNLKVGENAMICNNTWIMCGASVQLGNNSLIGEYARILSGSHDSNSISYRPVGSSIIIEDDCWIASCSILVAGRRPLKIGKGSIVSAGSVVMSEVRPMTIVIGNPAEYLADRSFVH